MEKNKEMTRFQIEQSWGYSCKAYVYFDAADNSPVGELEKIAIQEMHDDWKKTCEFPKLIGSHTPCRPTITVREYKDGKRVRKGINFKTKWIWK